MSSPPWQDRRGMFQPGKAVHEPARRTSQDEGQSKAAKPGGLSTLAASAGIAPEGATKFIYRRGKEVHEPSRKSSVSEAKPVGATAMPTSPTSPTTSTASTATTSTGGAVAGRRRSSASSQSGTRYSDLLSNPEHAQRRQTWEDMKAPGGFGGIFGGLLNKGPEKK